MSEEEVLHVGKETLAEFSGCRRIFKTAGTYRKHAVAAAKAAGATVKNAAAFHSGIGPGFRENGRQSISHTFSRAAITIVVVLAESHIAIHTWPEFKFVAVDIFTCGEKAINKKAIEYLKKIFQPKEVKTESFGRRVRIFPD